MINKIVLSWFEKGLIGVMKMMSLDFSAGLKLLSLAMCSLHYFYLADSSLTVVRHGSSHFTNT